MLDLDLEASREAEEVMIIGRGKEKGFLAGCVEEGVEGRGGA